MTESVEQMKIVVFDVIDRYTFIEEYVNSPSVLTGKQYTYIYKVYGNDLVFTASTRVPSGS